MPIETWEILAGSVGSIAGAVGGGFWSRRSSAERAATAALTAAEAERKRMESALELNESYRVLADTNQESLNDARRHIHRQDEEMRTLRGELARVRESRETELAAVRAELAAVRQELAATRQELANERNEKVALRDRVASLEAQLAAA